MERVESPWPDVSKDVGRPYDMEGAKSDILTSDGRSIWLMFNEFQLDLKPRPRQRLPDADAKEPGAGPRQVGLHRMAASGFLDDSWHDRMYWIFSRLWPGRTYGTKVPKAGQILVFDEMTTYALNASAEPGGMSPKFVPGTSGYRLIADGHKLAEYPLPASPVFDGMAAAGGCLYLSTIDGSVVCLTGRPTP